MYRLLLMLLLKQYNDQKLDVSVNTEFVFMFVYVAYIKEAFHLNLMLICGKCAHKKTWMPYENMNTTIKKFVVGNIC